MKAERITDSLAHHGEGPVWFETPGRLRFVDMLAGDVMTVEPSGEVTRTATGSSVVAIVRPRRGGGAILARENDVAVADADDLRDIRPLTGLFDDREMRTNEGGCDPQGRFYVGTMRYDKAAGGAEMFRVDAAGGVETLLTGLTVSNGLGWSPDHTLAYYVDTATQRVDVFDHTQHGEIVNRRPFIEVPEHAGHPDGLCIDAEGGVWVALNGGGRVHRYDAFGKLSEIVTLPVQKVTACTFGGTDLATLYLTTSREGLDDGEQPQAGSIFAAHPSVRGLVPLAFDG